MYIQICSIYLPLVFGYEGMRYSEARRLFDTAVPCGIMSEREQQLYLNPSENFVLETGDRVVFIAPSIDAAHLSGSKPAEIAPWIHSITSSKRVGQEMHVMVLCFGDDYEGLLEAMDEFSDEKIKITVVGR